MKSLETNFRLAAFVVLALLVLGLAPQNSLAQTVTVSPVALSYGVPTGTPGTPPASSQETATVSILGASVGNPVTFTGETVSGANSADFVIDGNSCAGNTFTSPATCLVVLHFNASLAPATTLETATLTISVTGATAPPPVPLSGAWGSIKLFDPTNVATPPGTTSVTNLYTIASKTLNLSCPANPTATLAGTPDGLGNLLVDNYITLATGSLLVPVTGIETNNPPGNLCSGTGSTADSYGNNDYQNCFTVDYELAARFGIPTSIIGLDPDTFTNSPNTVLIQPPPNPGGIPPITFTSSFLSSFLNGPYPEQALFTLLSSGPSFELDYSNSTVFLATSCSPGGLVPGGSITGNPTPTNTVSFDNNPGANFSLTDSSAQNPPSSGTTPVYTQIAVPQQLFYQLVANTSAAPDVCFRLSSELDYTVNPPAPMCAGVLVQCWDPNHLTLSGANCDAGQTQSLLRNLYFSLSFDSPDGPLGTNYLYNSTPNACSYYLGNVSGAACANSAQTGFTGPGLLAGGDPWLCAPGSTEPCTPLEPNASTGTVFNTQTPATTPIYVASLPPIGVDPNCVLTGNVAGDLCPLDLLTQFRGAADLPPAGNKGNSIYFPVANHPLPTATATVGQNGWVNSNTALVNFTANAATYNPLTTNPAANGFVAAPLYSVTFGITPASSPLPDTTYPVPGDITVWNVPTANQNFANPLCPAGTPSSFSPSPMIFGNPPGPLPADGLYNLHYFVTDCALTEGLVFNPQGSLTDPTLNWASFPFVAFGIDTEAPTFSASSCTPAPGPGNWYGGPSGNLTVTCTNAVTDQNWVSGVSGSGFLPLVDGIQGSQTETVSVSTSVASGSVSSTANATSPTPPACDLAGNCVSGGVSVGPYQIDLEPPTITNLSAGSSTYGGPPIPVTFNCSDGAGSGIYNCSAIASGGNLTYSCSGTAPVICSGTIGTSTLVLSGTLNVTALDNVGNQSTASVNYSVGQASQTITFSTSPPSSAAYNSSFPVAANASSGLAVAISGSGSCSGSGSGSATITMTSGTGTCTVTASQAGNSNYSPAPTLTPTVNATLAAQTITFGALPNQVLGSPPFPVSATASSGLAVSFNSQTTGVCTVSGSIVTLVAVGTCTIQATQAGNNNYAPATPVNQSFQVTPGTPLISFSPTSLQYGTVKQYSVTSLTIVVSNPGTATLTITKIAMQGHDEDNDLFRITNNCKSGVPPNGSCSFTVKFTASELGSLALTVGVTDNVAGSPQQIPISANVVRH